jgi:hypothetical protein
MGTHRHLLCWKSVLAGLFISITAFIILNALDAGIFGSIAESTTANRSGGASTLLTWAGVWMGVSLAISLLFGFYFTMRVNRFMTAKVGLAHGFVVASVFLLLLVAESGMAIGSLSVGVGKMLQGATEGAASLASSPAVEDTVNSALGNIETKSDMKTVVQGLATRLLAGNTDSAKNYFAYQTGMSGAEVDQRFNAFKAQFDQAVQTAAQRASNALADAGWTLFITFIVGIVASAIGGAIGAQSNLERPLAESEGSFSTFAAPLTV